MKKKFLVSVSIFIFLSCQNDKINDLIDTTSRSTIEQDLAVIKTLGFDETTAVDLGDYYQVEEDILLDKKNLIDYTKTNNDDIELRQGYNGAGKGKADISNVRNITVGLVTNNNDWKNAIINAIYVWNNIPGCAVNFRFITEGNPTISIVFESLKNNTIAESTFPSYGKIGNLIKINPYYNDFSPSEKTYTIMHELGHTLALRHTDGPQNGEPDIIAIPNTTNNDPQSVMNKIIPESLNAAVVFSKNDEVAAQYLYPENLIFTQYSLVSPNDPNNNRVTYTISRNTNRAAKWEAISNAVLESNSIGLSATFRVTGNGEVKIKAITDYTSSKSYSQENSSVWAGAPAKPTAITGIKSDRTYASFTDYPFGINSAVPGATSYSWEVLGDATLPMGSTGTSTILRTKNIRNTGSFSIYLTAQNKYGSSSTFGEYGNIRKSSGGMDGNHLGIER